MTRLHPESEKLIDETFEMYQEEKPLPLTITLQNPIIHMYASKDTRDEEGLDGFVDALFFRMDVYDTTNRIKYTSKREHDGISFSKAVTHQVRIFKDGSTMIILKGACEIDNFQDVYIDVERK